MSTAAKISLADVALALRDEQLEAKIVEYKGELATNPELDAVTAQVIAEVQSLQQAARAAVRPSVPELDAAQVERDLTQNLKLGLARIFRKGQLVTVIERKLGEVSKRFARLFFQSELAEKIRGTTDEVKVMRFTEQALYHAIFKSEQEIQAALEALPYQDDDVRDRSLAHFVDLLKDLRNKYLAQTTPELNTLVGYLNQILSTFFTAELPPALGELAREVVREAELAKVNEFGGYKISAKAFPTFRQVFERLFMLRLVTYTEEEMLKRVRESEGSFRAETIRFVADPAIFSSVCEIICDSVYDMLYNDGFLDLPNDWRARLSTEG